VINYHEYHVKARNHELPRGKPSQTNPRNPHQKNRAKTKVKHRNDTLLAAVIAETKSNHGLVGIKNEVQEFLARLLT